MLAIVSAEFAAVADGELADGLNSGYIQMVVEKHDQMFHVTAVFWGLILVTLSVSHSPARTVGGLVSV